MNRQFAGWTFLLAIVALIAVGCGGPLASVAQMGVGGVAAGAPAGTIDLLALAPTATWESGQLLPGGGLGQMTALPWQDSQSAGFAGVADYILEDGSTRPALESHPMWVNQGTIAGRFQLVALPSGAVFEAEVGFLTGAVNSDGVSFQVYETHYDANSNPVRTLLAQVTERCDGRLTPLRIDLAHLAGKIVSIELRVDAGATSMEDWAVWVAPRISGW